MSCHLPFLKPKEVLRSLTRAGFVIHHVSGRPLRSLALLRGRPLPNRLMASRQDEGRGGQIASYIKCALSEAETPLRSLEASLRQHSDNAVLCNRRGPPRLPNFG